MEFSKNQKAAISHVRGPMMVLAGPGSGKTAVITGRLEHLIFSARIPPEKILVVTFSKKAAAQMQERFIKRCGCLEKGPAFGTFHSIFYAIIRRSEGASLNVISESRKFQILRTALSRVNFDFENSDAFFSRIISEISAVKGNALDINGYAPKSLPGEIFRYTYRKYGEYLALNSLVDFDDMMARCFQLLSSDLKVLSFWQEKYPFILIDEFQDINLIQYETIRLLSEKSQNIFIVGDDDQSIYGFRGARPSLMKRFLKDYPRAKTILLDINYRSSEKIVKAAGRIIKENEARFPKNIRPLGKKTDEPDVSIRKFTDIKEESDEITKTILNLKNEGIPLSEIAVLLRNNADAEYISARLSDAGLGCASKKKDGGLYMHFISRDILSYAAAALKYPRCSLSDILLIMNKPPRFISRASASYSEEPFASIKRFYSGNGRMLREAEKFENDIRTIKTFPPFAAVKYIRNAAGYDKYLAEFAKESGQDLGKLEKVLSSLEEEAKKYETLSKWLLHADEENKRTGNPDEIHPKSAQADAVNILTMHSAKGLEWEAVFIPTCIDGLIPGRNTQTPSLIEEERRVLYVAMTRAKSFLYISYTENYRSKKSSPCRFLKPLLKKEGNP